MLYDTRNKKNNKGNVGPGTDFPGPGDPAYDDGAASTGPSSGNSNHGVSVPGGGGFSDVFDFDVDSSSGSGQLDWNNFNPKGESQWGMTTIGNVGGPGQPTFGRFKFGNTANLNRGFSNIGDAAQGGTLQNFNRAANRLRERVDALGKSQAQSGLNASLGRGIGGPEIAARIQGDADRESANAFAQGLVELEGGFEGFRQQGLQTALGAQSGIAELFGLGEQLKQADQESFNTLTNDAFQAERARLFEKEFNQANLTSEEKQFRLELLLKQAIERARLGSSEAIAEATGSGGNSLAIFNSLLDALGSLGTEEPAG